MRVIRTIIKWLGGLIGWLLILFGAFSVAFASAALVFVLRGGIPGEPMYLDAVAPTLPEAIKILAASLSVLLAGIGIRYFSGRGSRSEVDTGLRQSDPPV